MGRGQRYLSTIAAGCVHSSFLWEKPKGQMGRVKMGLWACLLWLQLQKGWTDHSTRSHGGLGWRGSPDLLSACSLFP